MPKLILSRATYFSYISSISYVITLLSPLLSAAAMSLNLCLPFVIGVMLLLMCILVIPGAASPSAPPSILRPEEGAASPLLQRRSSTDLKIDQTGPKSLSTEVKSSLVAIARQLQDRSFCLLLAVFFAASLASSNTPLLPQYISKRYGWSFAEAGILLSTKASINVLLLTIAVPYFIRQRLARPLAVGRTVNITGAKFSLVASIIGAVAIGLSGQIWQLLLGTISFFRLILDQKLSEHSICRIRDWFGPDSVHHVSRSKLQGHTYRGSYRGRFDSSAHEQQWCKALWHRYACSDCRDNAGSTTDGRLVGQRDLRWRFSDGFAILPFCCFLCRGSYVVAMACCILNLTERPKFQRDCQNSL